ncbi:MAG: alpha/beta fold hydrolase [Vicinamibacteria bacterium]|nr:alpha/beta fold hydrolase [Vicinamibacteria bacterium]
MKKMNIGGTAVQYDDKGSGPAVLFLHGFGLSLGMWDGQEALAPRYRVVRFDARGFGGSEVGDAILTMDRIAEDAAVLIERLRLGPVILVGCSMGGYAAFAFAQKHAALLRGLVLVDTRAGADSPEARKGRADLASKIMKEGPQAALDFFLPKVFGETTRTSRADVIARLKDIMLASSPQGLSDGLHGIAARQDSTPFLREISTPTLVVCGEEDAITPRAEAEIMHREIKGSELAMIPKSGHLPSMETPAEFNTVLGKFLARF